MSFLRRKSVGGRRAGAVVTGFAVAAFQALAIVGATTASAAGTCTYDPAIDRVTVTITGGGPATLSVDDPTGEILLDGASCTPGSATNDNTVSIVVLGASGTNERLVVDNQIGLEFDTDIDWIIDLGSDTGLLTGDVFEILGADGTDDAITVTDTSFDLNGGGGELNGVETIDVSGGDGDDTVDASALVDVVAVLNGDLGDDTLTGGDGDDTLTGGGGDDTLDGGDGDDTENGGDGDDTVYEGTAANGDDILTDTGVIADVDTLDYSGRTTAVIVDAPGNASGEDQNANGALGDVNDEADIGAGGYEVFMTGSGADTLIGDASDETFVPGDGDDDIDGGAGAGVNTLDYSTSTVGVTIDPTAGTASGQGEDTFTNVDGFVGSDFDDTLVYDGTPVAFDGGGGLDTLDASADTGGLTIDLTSNCGLPVLVCDFPNVENVTGGSGDDTITGNVLSNALLGGDGNDTIRGGLGNDWLEGGLGNDILDGEAGADTVSYLNAANGVEIDNSLLFATGDGEDSFGTAFEIIVGSAFDDQILSGQTFDDANQRIKGKGGDDEIVGSNSSDILSGGGGGDDIRAGAGDDTLRGGAGNDRLTAGAGDDILRGGKGRDVGNGGRGDDRCTGIERKKSC